MFPKVTNNAYFSKLSVKWVEVICKKSPFYSNFSIFTLE